MDEIACRRPGCCAALPVRPWAPRTYCSQACYWLDCRRLAPGRPRPVYRRRRATEVPSPSNNVSHRKIQIAQLELIHLELDRIRATRRATDAA